MESLYSCAKCFKTVKTSDAIQCPACGLQMYCTELCRVEDWKDKHSIVCGDDYYIKQLKLRDWIRKHCITVAKEIASKYGSFRYFMVNTDTTDDKYTLRPIIDSSGKDMIIKHTSEQSHERLLKNSKYIFIYFVCEVDKTEDSMSIQLL